MDFRERDRLLAAVAHGQCVAVNQIPRQHEAGGLVEIVGLIETQVLGKDFKQVVAALGDVVRQEFDTIDAHQCEQGVVVLLEVGFAVLQLHRSELAPQDLHQEVAAAAGRFQKPAVDAFGFALHQVEHGFHHPGRGEDFPVVGHALFGFHQVHMKAGFTRIRTRPSYPPTVASAATHAVMQTVWPD